MSIKPETLIVRREHLPERCEICHQSDQFDPVANHCSRCSLVKLSPTSNPGHRDLKEFSNQRTTIEKIQVAGLGMIYSFIFAAGLGFLPLFVVVQLKLGFSFELFMLGLGIVFVILSPIVGLIAGFKGQLFADQRAFRQNLPPSQNIDVKWVLCWITIAMFGCFLLLLSICGFFSVTQTVH